MNIMRFFSILEFSSLAWIPCRVFFWTLIAWLIDVLAGHFGLNVEKIFDINFSYKHKRSCK